MKGFNSNNCISNVVDNRPKSLSKQSQINSTCEYDNQNSSNISLPPDRGLRSLQISNSGEIRGPVSSFGNKLMIKM